MAGTPACLVGSDGFEIATRRTFNLVSKIYLYVVRENSHGKAKAVGVLYANQVLIDL